MDTQHVQKLLIAAGYFKGEADSRISNDLIIAAREILSRHVAECTSNPLEWPTDRQLVGAAQLVLFYAGNEPGKIDGYSGHNTKNAYAEWEQVQTHGQKTILPFPEEPLNPKSPTKLFPFQKDCRAFYGDPDRDGVKPHLVSIPLPFTMRLDWNLDQTVSKIILHAKCADSAHDALTDVLREYGIERIHQLGLDRFAGSYNHRRMRGGNSWSMHAYGCALDFFAAPNGLTTRAPQALFSRPDYVEFWDIWEHHGWVSLGRAIGRDWMHVQASRL